MYEIMDFLKPNQCEFNVIRIDIQLKNKFQRYETMKESVPQIKLVGLRGLNSVRQTSSLNEY
jgi:hypothetical protein